MYTNSKNIVTDFFTQLPKGQFNLRRATGNALAIQKLENII